MPNMDCCHALCLQGSVAMGLLRSGNSRSILEATILLLGVILPHQVLAKQVIVVANADWTNFDVAKAGAPDDTTLASSQKIEVGDSLGTLHYVLQSWFRVS